MRGVRRDRCAAGCNEAWAFLLLWIEGSVLLGFFVGCWKFIPFLLPYGIWWWPEFLSRWKILHKGRLIRSMDYLPVWTTWDSVVLREWTGFTPRVLNIEADLGKWKSLIYNISRRSSVYCRWTAGSQRKVCWVSCQLRTGLGGTYSFVLQFLIVGKHWGLTLI